MTILQNYLTFPKQISQTDPDKWAPCTYKQKLSTKWYTDWLHTSGNCTMLAYMSLAFLNSENFAKTTQYSKQCSSIADSSC